MPDPSSTGSAGGGEAASTGGHGRAARDAPVLLVHWERTVGDLLDRTGRFPRSARFSFAARIDGLALDVLERLVRARWASRGKQGPLLAEADADLAVLRTLLRLSFDRRLLDRGGLEHVSRQLDEAGRMLGGWRRSVDGR